MSASMVLSFMPSIAFAAANDVTADAKIAKSWAWEEGSKTASLVLAHVEGSADESYAAGSVKATVKYVTPGTTTEVYPCGKAQKVDVIFICNKLTAGTQTYNNVLVDFPEHDYVATTAKSATCAEDGNFAYKVCKACGHWEVEDTVNNRTEKGDVTELTYAKGLEAAKAKANIPGKAHIVTLDSSNIAWNVTSSASANDKVKLMDNAELTCDKCGKKFKTNVNTAAAGYTPAPIVGSNEAEVKDAKTIKKATCTENGEKAVTGTVTVPARTLVEVGTSNYVTVPVKVVYAKKEVIKAAGQHSSALGEYRFVWDKKDPTKCTIQFNYCTNSDCTYAEKSNDCVVEVAKAACKSSDGKTWYKATYTTPEGKVYTTTEAQYNKVDATSAHNIVSKDAKEATCFVDGYKAHYECKDCGKWFKKTSKGRYVQLDETEKAKLVVAAAHSYTGAVTLNKTDKEIAEAFTTTKALPAGISATITNPTCKVCGHKLSDKTTGVVTIDGKEFNKVNAGKNACVDGYVLPLVVKKDNNVVTTMNVTCPATKHNSTTADGTAPKFEFDASDANNVTCKAIFKGCTNHNIICKNPDAEDGNYIFADAEKACGEAVAAQPAKVEVKSFEAPTCKKEGKGSYVATYTHSQTGKIYKSEEKTFTFAKTGHKPTAIEAVAPTVFTEGTTAGVKCANCGEIMEAPKTVAKAKYAAPVVKAGKKSATVTVKATEGAVKYQISYKKVGGKYVTKTVKAGKKVTIKKLAKGKKYTFKAVAINADGVKATSAVKTVKIK